MSTLNSWHGTSIAVIGTPLLSIFLAVLPVYSVVAQVGEPDIQLVDLGIVYDAIIDVDLQATNGPIMWSELSTTTGSPAVAAMLTADGNFQWHTIGSARSRDGFLYSWSATAMNNVGSDRDVALTLRLSIIPEPASMLMAGLAMVGLLVLVRRR